MRDPRQVWHCERHYRVFTRGLVHSNCGIRCCNDGVAAGLYSQPGVVIAQKLLLVIGFAVVPFAVMVMLALPRVTPVVLAALTASPPGELTKTPGRSVTPMGVLVAVVSTLMLLV